MKNIFTYTSYRELLKDYYEEKKATVPKFSFQSFSDNIGFNTKSYLIDIIRGRKSLSKKGLFGLIKTMDLDIKETSYFETLVNFNNAKKTKEREFYFERLKELAGKTGAKKIGSNQFDYFSKWYHVVIREMLVMNEYKGNKDIIASSIRPRITAKQVKDAIKVLVELGIVIKTPGGKYKRGNTQITSEEKIHSLAILRHQEQMLTFGAQALERFKKKDQYISTISAGISNECYEAIKNKMDFFYKSVVDMVAEDKGETDMVYQINFQIFPLTKPQSEE